MLIAQDKDGLRHPPIKNLQAYCPECMKPVVAKMGEIYIHHWAHQRDNGCTNGQGETLWHLENKMFFGIDNTEIKIGNRRADVVLEDKKQVIEIQKQNQTRGTLLNRTKNYRDNGYSTCWIFNGYEKFYGASCSHPPGYGSMVDVEISYRMQLTKLERATIVFWYFRNYVLRMVEIWEDDMGFFGKGVFESMEKLSFEHTKFHD